MGEGFEYKEINEEHEYGHSIHRWSTAYAVLGMIVVFAAFLFLFSGELGYAIVLFVFGIVIDIHSRRMHKEAHRYLDD